MCVVVQTKMPVAHPSYSSGLGALRGPTKVESYSETRSELGSQLNSLISAQFSAKCVDEIAVY